MGRPTSASRKTLEVTPKASQYEIVSFREYKQDTDAWLTVYHLRSIIENVFSFIKKRWGSFLLSRRRWMQKK